MYITYIASTCFGFQNTILREHVMPSLKSIVTRQATYLWFFLYSDSWFEIWNYVLPEDGVLKAENMSERYM
jgi:hypothetical protein